MTLATLSFLSSIGMFAYLKFNYQKISILKNIYVLKFYLILMCAFIGLMAIAFFKNFGVDIFTIMFSVMAVPVAIVYPVLIVISSESTIKNVVQTRIVQHYDTKLW